MTGSRMPSLQPPAVAPEGAADAGAFLVRLLRLDQEALVRLRPVRTGFAAMWARLPFGVLATRLVASSLTQDATLRAADLLRLLEREADNAPERLDLAWRTPLPPSSGDVLEQVPAKDLQRISEAAADTMRAAGGRGVGERRLRDALLDQVVLTVTVPAPGGGQEDSIEVPLRLVQGLVRMGFLGGEDAPPARIRRSAGWLGVEARYGAAWHRPASPLRITGTGFGNGRPVPT